MAIYHFHTKIIKSSIGKCAVASAAYMSASELYDDRLGKWFAYTNKEEVIHAEILLPENAPKEFFEREVLWNEVERVQNKSNSRYARQFDMALPIELSKEQMLELSHNFVQKNFVDLGMVADFAIHNKKGNPHLHVMCTVRGFKKDGTWATMERKIYATDKNGERIPIIEPKTSKQKVRVRKGKGEEKLWKRVTVESNDWNKKEQLVAWREAWSYECNKYLSEKDKIDHRSFEEQGINKVPTIHEGYAARKMENQGLISERVADNIERKELNAFLVKLNDVIAEAKMQIQKVKRLYEEKDYGKERSNSREGRSRGSNEHSGRIQRDDTGTVIRDRQIEQRQYKVKKKSQRINPKEYSPKELLRIYSERAKIINEENRKKRDALGLVGKRSGDIEL